MSKIARLSQSLNITGAFDPNVVERLKKNVSTQDSASFILLSSFNNARNFLKVNKREEVGYLIAAGSFIEGLHMLISIAKDNKSKEIMDLVAEQKIFLYSVDDLLKMNSHNEGIKNISDDFSELKGIYEKVIIEVVPGDKAGQQVVKSMTITDEQFASISTKVAEMRKSFLE